MIATKNGTRSWAAAYRRCLCMFVALGALAGLGGAQRPARAADQPFTVYAPLILHSGPPVTGLPFDPKATRTGEATFYDATGAGNCSFPATPNDLMVAAMNETDYAGSLICGAYVEITGPLGVVVVRIVDRCPECPVGNIDLSEEAFVKIANRIDGRVPITWRLLSPALAGPIEYYFKDGSSEWWTAVQIRNHRNPIYRVEYRLANGSFKVMGREMYNYFVEPNGTRMTTLTLRVTDIYGNTLTDSGIPILNDAGVQGSGQFPAAP